MPQKTIENWIEEYGVFEHCHRCECMVTSKEDAEWKRDSINALADHLLGLPSLQDDYQPEYDTEMGRVSAVVANTFIKQIRQEIAEALSVNIASKD